MIRAVVSEIVSSGADVWLLALRFIRRGAPERAVRTARARVDVVSFPSLRGLWAIGGYYELEMLLASETT